MAAQENSHRAFTWIHIHHCVTVALPPPHIHPKYLIYCSQLVLYPETVPCAFPENEGILLHSQSTDVKIKTLTY